MSVPKKEPATPRSIVTMMPPGSFPGMISLATAPTISPIINVHMRPIGQKSPFSFGFYFIKSRSTASVLKMFCTHSHQTTIARSNGGIFAIRADGCATGIEQRSRFNHVDRGSDRSDFELHIDHGLLADCKG